MRGRGAVLVVEGAKRPYAISRPLEILDIELDAPGPTEVLVQVRAAGLCHSDLSVIDGTRPRPLPMLLGHEAAGIVVACGADVQGLSTGDHVISTFVPACRLCESCLSGRPALCEPGNASNVAGTLLSGERRIHTGDRLINHHVGISAFAEYAVISARSLVKVPESLPFDIAAAFGCAVITGVGAVINAANIAPGMSVAVIGLGGVGMAAVMGARAAGAQPIIAIDLNTEKLSIAKTFGATEVFHASNPGVANMVREVTRGGVNAALEMAGSVAALDLAWAITRRGGVTVTSGLPAADARASYSPAQLVGEERVLRGSYLGSGDPARDVPKYIAWYEQGRLPVNRLISSHISLDDINSGLDLLASASGLRHVVTFDARDRRTASASAVPLAPGQTAPIRDELH
jgi:alcohol dehydrogenase